MSRLISPPLSRRATALSLSAVLASGIVVAVPTIADASTAQAGVSVATVSQAGVSTAVSSALKKGVFPVLRYNSRGYYVRNLQWKLRIHIDGWFGPQTLRAVKRFQKAHHLPVTGVVTAATWRLLKWPPKKKVASATYTKSTKIRVAVARLNWKALAKCESGGRPTAVNPAGYYGLFQFNLGTWRGVGGKGYPHRASASEQLYRAQLLYQRRGARPWPYCGRRLYT